MTYLEVALNLFEYILGCAAKENCARLRVFAICQEREILIAYLPYFEETTTFAYVRLFDLVNSLSARSDS